MLPHRGSEINRTIHALVIALITFSAHSFAHDSTIYNAKGFKSQISLISPQMQAKMKQMHTWHEGCPVPFNELRSITLTYWGFDNKPHLGRLIINQSVATEVVQIFKSLYRQHFPIKQIEPMDLYKGDDDLAMMANNTSSFNCRAVTGQPGVFSQHSYGRAIDINPLINPYVKDNQTVLPASAKYVDRHVPFPGKIYKDSPIYKIFTQKGWDWGGSWYDVQDYQHFEKRANGEKRNPYGYGQKNKRQPGDIEKTPCLVLLDPINAPKIPVSTSQVIVVHSTTGFKANITACERSGKTWMPAITPFIKGVIGTNGVASIGEKKEGDRKTPAGIYPIGETFGIQPLAVHMDYRYITADDKFIDDVNSKHYNTWVNGPTDAKSYESMLIDPYKLGAVINYNMNPVVPGAGSAIFMHVWRTPNTSTAGCVAIDETSLLNVLNWLDKKQRPYIYIE